MEPVHDTKKLPRYLCYLKAKMKIGPMLVQVTQCELILQDTTIMDKSLGTLLRFWDVSHPTNNVGRVYPKFFSEFQLWIGWQEGQLLENVEKDALF